ncbi:carboxypeptidase-like regulatory domain-containing protein [Yinghuangia seranimata]|uniref:carboxypeptidase-like regulatory domain-containing protein n=1 Tax=Yinghuangia seranimata TaxID=408067 RepID=UPI00248D3A07|nr:carboxypeptidase-like regulatory domain-containing protein [Yinghuangia seranimata]MDI2132676.1 carboxypeptidase-like regulatory domain-containing protein [Yinghuangia seranimata]
MFTHGGSVRRAVVAATAALVLGGALGACKPFDDDKDAGKGAAPSGASSASASNGTDGKAGSSGGETPKAPSGKVEKGVVKGHVSDGLGNPVKGAKVVVDNQLLYDSNMVLVTDDRGDYRAEMPPMAATYAVTASFDKTYNGTKYTFRLAAQNPDPFAGNEGAVRDFTWKLSGPQEDLPDAFYGGSVLFYLNPTNPADGGYADSTNVQFTLTPVGTLADGSTGKTVTRKAESTGDGFGVRDIPVGRYKITASYLNGPGGRPQPVKLQIRNSGQAPVAELTADFKQYLTDHQRIELEAQL